VWSFNGRLECYLRLTVFLTMFPRNDLKEGLWDSLKENNPSNAVANVVVPTALKPPYSSKSQTEPLLDHIALTQKLVSIAVVKYWT